MDTSETGLEKIIVDWLVQHNGYEQETPHAFNKDFALVDKWVERFVTETQPVEQMFTNPKKHNQYEQQR
jgi:type I restriction enzyme R subunit